MRHRPHTIDPDGLFAPVRAVMPTPPRIRAGTPPPRVLAGLVVVAYVAGLAAGLAFHLLTGGVL